MLYVTRMTQNKIIDLINSILQHGRVVDNNCYLLFLTSTFLYLILCPKLKVGTTYLAIRTKNDENTFEYKYLLLLKPPQITKSNIEHWNH